MAASEEPLHGGVVAFDPIIPPLAVNMANAVEMRIVVVVDLVDNAPIAPRAPVSEHVGERASFELDHIEALFKGGDVYDTGNLQIMTPAAHIEKTRHD